MTNPNLAQIDHLSLFKLIVSKDGMTVHIPAKTKISKRLYEFTYEDICSYLNQLGYKIKIKENIYQELKKISISKEPYFLEDFVILKGRPFMDARGDILKWTPQKNSPPDLIQPGIPFAKIFKSRGCLPAVTVFGVEIPLTNEQLEKQPGDSIDLPEEVTVNSENILVSKVGGQVSLKTNKLMINLCYVIEKLNEDYFKKVHFPCSVEVKCDLSGEINWVIDNDLTVQEFWSASNIIVKGNVKANGGIQTNLTADENSTIQVLGNMEANYIQSSRFFVGGSLKILKAVTNSNLVVVKDLDCTGDPGRISACEIELKEGILKAKIVGSEKEKPSAISFASADFANNSSITSLGEGTRIKIGRSRFIVQTTQFWPQPQAKTK